MLYVRRMRFIQAPRYLMSSQAASGERSKYEVLIKLFERLGNSLKRLEIYTTIPLTSQMTEPVVKTMIGPLSILGLTTKKLKDGEHDLVSQPKDVSARDDHNVTMLLEALDKGHMKVIRLLLQYGNAHGG